MDAESEIAKIAQGIRKLSAKVPRSVATRIGSTLNHFEKSRALRTIDLEMASFRAICGEEEASAAVISALHHRKMLECIAPQDKKSPAQMGNRGLYVGVARTFATNP